MAAKQFAAIARLTATETIRQPITLLLMTVCVVATSILPLVISHTLGESAKMIADSSLALHFVFGLLLGGFSACTSLSGEIRRGTAATMLSKPVTRTVFFFAKFAGLALVMLTFSFTVTLASILSVRTVTEAFLVDWWAALPLLAAPVAAYLAAALVNYFTRRPFAGDAFMLLTGALVLAFVGAGFVDRSGQWTAFGANYNFQLAAVAGLVAMAVLILTALALGLATRLEVVPTISICSAVFLLGLTSDYLFGRHAADSVLAGFLYAALPNWQHFWLADALHLAHPIPAVYWGRAALYGLFYLVGILLLGAASFRHTEVKA